MRTQLLALLKPFSGRLVRPPAKGKYGDYVSHYVVEQRLLSVVGPYSWAIVPVRDGDGWLTGCIGTLTCEVDGRTVSVSGAGDVENPRNDKLTASDGERLKLAESDAFKRAAMRLGVGLHLWAQDDFYVYDLLSKSESDAADTFLTYAIRDSDTGAIPSEGDPAVSDTGAGGPAPSSET